MDLHKLLLLFWIIGHLIDRSVPFFVEQALSFPVKNIKIVEHSLAKISIYVFEDTMSAAVQFAADELLQSRRGPK